MISPFFGFVCVRVFYCFPEGCADQACSNEHVDPYRTTTNDVYETCVVLGIEAVRMGVELEMKNGLYFCLQLCSICHVCCSYCAVVCRYLVAFF